MKGYVEEEAAKAKYKKQNKNALYHTEDWERGSEEH